jgi:hypothetical protein
MTTITTLADLTGYTLIISFISDGGPPGTKSIFYASDNVTPTPTRYFNITINPPFSSDITFEINNGGLASFETITISGGIVSGTQYIIYVKFEPNSIATKKVFSYSGATLSQLGNNPTLQTLNLSLVNNPASFSFGGDVGTYLFGRFQKAALFLGDPTGTPGGNIEALLDAANPNTGSYTFVSNTGWNDVTVALNGGPTTSSTEVTLNGASQNMTFQSFAAYGGGGGAGDPYVTTVDGVRYKLPIMDGPIRFYQGAVDGKTLTINASLRTFENTDMIAENIRSYNDLKGKVPAYKLNEVAKSIFKAETLAFFEKFHINYDGTEMTVDVWDHKFKIDSYTGARFPSTLVDGKALTQKYTGIYQEYKSQTLKLQIGSARLFLSVYPAKLLKNGIFFEANDLESGNGVIVNTLSQADMTLKSLTDLTPAPKKNTRPHEKTEWFLDKDGYRTKKILKAA